MYLEKRAWVYDLLLILVLAVGTYFRTVGLDWDAEQHLHPDERFLTMVESALDVKKCAVPNTSVNACPEGETRWLNFSDYLDTQTSPLNPQNRGYGFFVYGDFPTILVRYVAEWLGQTGYDQVHLVGRQLSALSDLLTILLLYIIGSRLYNRRVALLGAAFSALAVEQIQQSHFLIVDNFANLFIFLAVFFAVEILIRKPTSATADQPANDAEEAPPAGPEDGLQASPHPSPVAEFFRFFINPFVLLSVGFGVSLGLAVSSKLNAAPLAVLLPGAFILRYFTTDRRSLAEVSRPQPDPDAPGQPESESWPISADYWSRVLVYLMIGGAFTVLVFRLAQPYAFVGLRLNPAWLQNIRDLLAQSSGDADVPFALQWARRSHLFSFKNLTEWGLGLPLGILAWSGFLYMAWRIYKGELRHALLWGWTALYFGWQSMAFNPTMRYQLPIYPLLCLMAGWLLVTLWDKGREREGHRWSFLFRPASLLIGVLALALTLTWAYAFTRIYTRPVTRVAATDWIYQNIPGPLNARIQTGEDAVYQQPLDFPAGAMIAPQTPYSLAFMANASGTLHEIYFPHIASAAAAPAQLLSVAVTPAGDPSINQPLATASLMSDFSVGSDPRGREYTLVLDHPIEVTQGQVYTLLVNASDGLTLSGAAPINESDWDDGLPLRLGPQGYDGFGGLYQNGLNLQIYYDDNADKLTRFVDTLAKGDAIFMSSDRQWATVTRVPERYPLTTAYYRALIGCPPDKDVIWCYNVARPGMFQGRLGFKLAAVFESFPGIDIPGLFHWQANDQFAEEAFTVYDHPKVLIFVKQPDFSAEQVERILGAVDLSHVVHLTPRQAGSYKSLLLSPIDLARQQAAGTWSTLFNYEWIQNRFPVLGLVIWYGFIFLLGVLVYPVLRLALPGLGDKGYPLARVLGLALLAYLSWLAGSMGVPVTRLTVALVFAAIAIAGITVGWWKRAELAGEWKLRWRYFLLIEGLFFAFFLFDLLIRIGNPDLWHPAKGGERPMDFSYFNAILKSSIFPPYDPWFAGGYINYYYYGFVLAAMPVKLLGIVPTLAYNFLLPTLFACVAMGAFCVAWNLVDGTREAGSEERESRIEDRASSGEPDEVMPEVETAASEAANDSRITVHGSRSYFDYRLLAGVLAALLMVVLGNLGTVRMIYQGLERIGAPGGNIDSGNIAQRFLWAAEGAGGLLQGQSLPYGRGDWYWDPSRVIPPGPGNEITEFPFFTFLYSDLHAHMLAMPLALLALAWALSVVRARRVSVLSIVVGALAIGALYPTNLSDIYTYLPMAFAVLAYSIWRSDMAENWHVGLPLWLKKLALIAGSTILLVGLSYLLYAPYRAAYSQGYGALDPWNDSKTPIWSYFTHWGVFLFIITFWLAWETRQWMASTPVSSLNKLRPYQIPIEAGIAVFLVALLYLAYRGVDLGWVSLPLAVWAGVLLLRPGMPDVKRFALFLTGTALLITIVVEIVVVRGDIGRMNTIFKFSLQAWALLAVSAAAAFAWLIPELRQWLPGWRKFFQAGVVVLLAGAGLYTVSGTTDKIMDRMSATTPLTLDSISYMPNSQYADFGVTMDLVHDYKAIRWMQDNIQGSPVIVEANCPEYHWCSRFTIYTGLPGVVGWNWHQRQQRTEYPEIVEERVSDVDSFYMTTDINAAREFLTKYNVKYIVDGQLEQAEYKGPGLFKFGQYDGKLWNAVYRDDGTVIYQVLP
ncbi:MAG TPA: DUF2298 domain-containing protein [Anaerolineales bacterium]|nr:DUF2298 domain-containing protein [Anaerolineales bacterium]